MFIRQCQHSKGMIKKLSRLVHRTKHMNSVQFPTYVHEYGLVVIQGIAYTEKTKGAFGGAEGAI